MLDMENLIVRERNVKCYLSTPCHIQDPAFAYNITPHKAGLEDTGPSLGYQGGRVPLAFAIILFHNLKWCVIHSIAINIISF